MCMHRNPFDRRRDAAWWCPKDSYRQQEGHRCKEAVVVALQHNSRPRRSIHSLVTTTSCANSRTIACCRYNNLKTSRDPANKVFNKALSTPYNPWVECMFLVWFTSPCNLEVQPTNRPITTKLSIQRKITPTNPLPVRTLSNIKVACHLLELIHKNPPGFEIRRSFLSRRRPRLLPSFFYLLVNFRIFSPRTLQRPSHDRPISDRFPYKC
mmetsp:Transcript_40116/g.59490  ORF Transcript_40116/g.59490 Transcript_40116/m.59490 type:complete len:210 (-) Transcript_40116:242-871(-)